jgi:hypothetical protein
MTYRNRAAITALLARAVPGAVTTAVLRGCNHGPDRLGRRPVHAAGWRSRGGTHQSHVLRCRAGPVDRHPDHGAVLSAGQRAPFPAPPKRGRLLPGGVAAARCSGVGSSGLPRCRVRASTVEVGKFAQSARASAAGRRRPGRRRRSCSGPFRVRPETLAVKRDDDFQRRPPRPAARLADLALRH